MRERLIQEDYVEEPWRMLVCCILLNQTSNQQVRKVLPSVFSFVPDPATAVNCDVDQLVQLIKSTGFSRVKAQRIMQMSHKWLEGFDQVSELPGVGRYAHDSWKIFIQKIRDLEVTDKKLAKFLDEVWLDI
jgi:endonuclease III